MTADDIQVRRDICEGCKLACEVRSTIDHANPCMACPAHVWHAFGDCEREQLAPPAMRGLGDIVALVAQPIARGIDRMTGGRTNVAGCGGCKKRQESLNKKFPLS